MVSEVAEKIKALKAAHTVEATPQRTGKRSGSAEEPVTAAFVAGRRKFQRRILPTRRNRKPRTLWTPSALPANPLMASIGVKITPIPPRARTSAVPHGAGKGLAGEGPPLIAVANNACLNDTSVLPALFGIIAQQ